MPGALSGASVTVAGYEAWSVFSRHTALEVPSVAVSNMGDVTRDLVIWRWFPRSPELARSAMSLGLSLQEKFVADRPGRLDHAKPLGPPALELPTQPCDSFVGRIEGISSL